MDGPFTDAVMTTLEKFYEGLERFLPNLFAALVIIAIGWLVAWVLKKLIRRTLVLARFDQFCDSTGASQMLARADIRAAPSECAGRFAFWIVFISFLMIGLSALNVGVIDRLIAEFFMYLPKIFAALLILFVGFLIGNFLSRAALLAAVNANMPSPRAISLVVKFLIAILAFAMALEQLEIATSIVTAAFIIAFGAVMLGLAIAFGLGGRDVARRVLEKQFLEKKEQEPDEFSHI